MAVEVFVIMSDKYYVGKIVTYLELQAIKYNSTRIRSYGYLHTSPAR